MHGVSIFGVCAVPKSGLENPTWPVLLECHEGRGMTSLALQHGSIRPGMLRKQIVEHSGSF